MTQVLLDNNQSINLICIVADTRDIDENRRNQVIDKIHSSAITIAKKRKVSLSEFNIINQDPPAISDESIVKAVASASQELNLSHKLMISRAYHDSLFMARYARQLWLPAVIS